MPDPREGGSLVIGSVSESGSPALGSFRPVKASDIVARVPAEIASIVEVAVAAAGPKTPAAAAPYTRAAPVKPMAAPFTTVSKVTGLFSAAVMAAAVPAPTAPAITNAPLTPMEPPPVAHNAMPHAT